MARRARGTSETHVSDRSIASDVALISDRIREAGALRTPLRISGAGTWLDAGRPCRARETLSLAMLHGIVRYEPGDFTLTARAGTSLAEIEHVASAEGQWLTLDASGAREGTLGATVATGSAGPLASAFGTPRDHVLGCEFVSGTGDVVRAGGRVVKNVAGFDLVRLVTGAWGTLGALTEVTVRLRARPQVDRTLAIDVAGTTPASIADACWRWLRQSEYTPLAAEAISPTLAARLGLGTAACVVRVGGNDSFVRAASDAAASLGITRDVDVGIWRALSSAEPPGALTFRVSTLPSRIGAVWARATDFAERNGGYAHATLSRGVVRCVVPAPAADSSLENLRAGLSELASSATVIGERLPASLWDALSRVRSIDRTVDGIRRAFDPAGIMNVGILGGT